MLELFQDILAKQSFIHQCKNINETVNTHLTQTFSGLTSDLLEMFAHFMDKVDIEIVISSSTLSNLMCNPCLQLIDVNLRVNT